MDECAIDKGYGFQNVLQGLPKIVTISQVHVLVQHNVDLHVELVAGVIGLQSLDLSDGSGEAHGEIQQDVSLISCRSRA